MLTAKSVRGFLFQTLIGLGALACILVWAGIKPGDLRMSLAWPHWIWLVSGLLLFAISLWSSGRSLYLHRRVASQREKALESQIQALTNEHKAEIDRLTKGHGAEIAHKDTFCASAYSEARKLEKELVALKEELANKEKLLMSAALKAVHAERELTELKAPDMSLRGRVFAITQDLLVYLKEKGCNAEWEGAPPSQNLLADNVWGHVPLDALQSHSAGDHAAIMGADVSSAASMLDSAQATMDSIHYGFERKFKIPLQTLYIELRENGIRDYQLEQELYGHNPGHLGRFYCSNIGLIAERLLVVWSRMEL
jgi:hypothetical protein